ncbi:unnamed protein product [Sphagnum jensenii]|uniref:Glycosyl transferase family 1 domain-containing protein n=1 Tax=Sphagnum jensenii TaxID=128206 RepID=A0ABP0VB91_9BRYO
MVHLNGVDRDPIEPSWREALRRKIIARWGFAEATYSSTRVFGVVARLAPEKRHQHILEVMLALRVQHPDFSWTLLCFGSGPLEAKLKSFTQEHGLDSQVKWMGYREGLSAEMAGFDVLLSLSQGEGLPINVLEAGWAATPIFASAVDGLNDLILGGEGHLVPPHASPSHLADQLFEFSKDRASLEVIGKKFLERVSQNFSGKIWLENLQKIYDEL